jgi:hypothetical protein
MNPCKQRLALFFLSRALRCGCQELVPRSGSEGAKVNCYSIYVNNGEEPYLLVRRLVGTILHCSKWNGAKFEDEIEVNLSTVDDSELSITHFYGYSEIQYKGIVSFTLGRSLFLPYMKVHVVRMIESADQYFFNKKKLVTKQRIDLLRFLVARKLDGHAISSPVNLMTGLYSIKWVLHPDRDPQRRRLSFYLDSLVDTDEVSTLSSRERLMSG